MDEKSPLAQSLRFNPLWWVDPAIFGVLEREVALEVAKIQLQFVRDTLGREAEAVGQVIEVLGR